MKQALLIGAGWLVAICSAVAQPPESLPGTTQLTWEETDLSARLMDGAHRFVERKIAESASRRTQFWARDFSSPEAYAKSVQTNRARFRSIIGAVDPRLPIRMERFGDAAEPMMVTETSGYRVFQVRWPVLEGLSGHGLLVQPKGKATDQPLSFMRTIEWEMPYWNLGLGLEAAHRRTKAAVLPAAEGASAQVFNANTGPWASALSASLPHWFEVESNQPGPISRFVRFGYATGP